MVLVGAVLAISACGADQPKTSLAIERVSVVDGIVRATTECADEVRADVRPDPAGSGLLEVSLWGTPKLGRCHRAIALDDVSPDTTKLVDAATGQVVDVSR